MGGVWGHCRWGEGREWALRREILGMGMGDGGCLTLDFLKKPGKRISPCQSWKGSETICSTLSLYR